jgi:hypothetical protein
MKNEKMNLADLKVKSFVTDFKKDEENTIKGGRTVYCSIGGYSQCPHTH